MGLRQKAPQKSCCVPLSGLADSAEAHLLWEVTVSPSVGRQVTEQTVREDSVPPWALPPLVITPLDDFCWKHFILWGFPNGNFLVLFFCIY